MESISNNPNVKLYKLKNIKATNPFLLIFKVLYYFFALFYYFATIQSIDYLIIQNPPLLPLIFVSKLAKVIVQRNMKIVIDWHNLSYSLLQYRFSSKMLIEFVRYLECISTRFSIFLHLTVTHALKLFLENEFNVTNPVVVLYDKPNSIFTPLNEVERQDFRSNHHLLSKYPNHFALITSTSYSRDEQLVMLLRILATLDNDPTVSSILLIVTGKGDDSDFNSFRQSVAWKKTKIYCDWLSFGDYRKFLACADLGVSMHSSSSGLDLPMKILDMHGCGLPVVSIRYECIEELIKEGKNGWLFDSEEECVELLKKLIGEKGVGVGSRVDTKIESVCWEEEWKRSVETYFI